MTIWSLVSHVKLEIRVEQMQVEHGTAKRPEQAAGVRGAMCYWSVPAVQEDVHKRPEGSGEARRFKRSRNQSVSIAYLPVPFAVLPWPIRESDDIHDTLMMRMIMPRVYTLSNFAAYCVMVSSCGKLICSSFSA